MSSAKTKPRPNERRHGPRTELVLKVEYDSADDLMADYLTDIGGGGLFICTNAPLAVGQQLHFWVSFPGLLQPIELQGVVRWQRDSDEGRGVRAGVGVELTGERPVDLDALLAQAQQSNPPKPQASSRPFRVLLVEDNQFTQKLFQHAVKRFHRRLAGDGTLDLCCAEDGQVALSYLANEPFDLAIVDYFLPVMTGAQLIRKMRADPRFVKTPILVISVGGSGVREDSMDAGADLYVDKPVLLKSLLDTLQLLLISGVKEEGVS